MSTQSDIEALLRQVESYSTVDPLLYLKGLAVARRLALPEARFVRAKALQALVNQLQSAMVLCNFQNRIVVRQEGVFVDIGGILMESSRVRLYLKGSGPVVGKNLGDNLADALHGFHIDVSTAIDVGANYGEISLSLARRYPRARIIAIEPSSANLEIFTVNTKVQEFPTKNIEILHLGVTDKAGTASIDKAAGTMSRVREREGESDAEPVTCERLDTLLDRKGVATADFVKIDIEGGEPKLREAIVALGGRVRSYYIEFSQFEPFDEYIALAQALFSCGFSCYDETATARLATSDDVARHLRPIFTAGPLSVTNLWFVAGQS